MELIEQAKRLEAAGVFSMVLECVPEEVAKEVTAAVSVRAIYTYLLSVAVVRCSIVCCSKCSVLQHGAGMCSGTSAQNGHGCGVGHGNRDVGSRQYRSRRASFYDVHLSTS